MTTIRCGTKKMAAVIAAATMLVASLVAAPIAEAQTGRAYVAMGDSFPANPDIPEQLDGLVRGYCAQRDNAYPDRIGHQHFGGNYVNLACNGTTLNGKAGPGVIAKMNSAHARGEIGSATQLVTLTVGAAEGWNPATPSGRDFGFLDGGNYVTSERWTSRMAPVINRIKQIAPQARVMFVSYPEVGNNRGAICLANFGAQGSAHVPVPVPTNFEGYIDRINGTAAAHQHLGYEFVKTDRPGTGSCAPASKQWVRGIIDIPGAGDGMRMPVHPTAVGDAGVANIVMSRL